MSRITKLPLLALIGAMAAGAAATSASARQFSFPPCEQASWGACGGYEAPTQPASRSRQHDTSPTYMKQTDPRYSNSMTTAGGGGGGGGGGGR
ncbi:conserved hypothetical protein [Bradyrhizobium oligotrophicum S58]|uniref:Uncharacterized protein n=1 Tax=Bradyrhizobium oligotrophicum S58 TaxID=1245469 RepID=M4ZAX6_9BRAD|nr:hypothetical protein [Bradyrhizobium oligotrophicum]BAM90551.1 conserved hypothetical protein [Bradyrhizobium oligotrophicum S58]